MILYDDLILLGTLARTHGKQGELQLNYKDDLLREQEDVRFLVLERDGIPTPFRLEDWRDKGAESYIVSLADITSEEDAQALCGTKVYLLRRDLTAHPEEDILTLEDLLGYRVEDVQKGIVGTIVEVDESTQNALFLLDTDAVIPAHDDFVEEIDPSRRLLRMSLPDGLL